MKFGIHSVLFSETFADKDLPRLEQFMNLGSDAVEIIPFDPEAIGWGYLSGNIRWADEWRRGTDACREIAGHASEAAPGMILGIEPINRFESHFINTAADAGRFIQDVGAPTPAPISTRST